MESFNHIKPNGKIVVEDTHTSFMKKKGFKNPSNYSFINFSKLIVENMHRRNPMISKKLNKLSQKIESIIYYDSIVSINFSSKNLLKKLQYWKMIQRKETILLIIEMKVVL